jgi:hypothetical protein
MMLATMILIKTYFVILQYHTGVVIATSSISAQCLIMSVYDHLFWNINLNQHQYRPGSDLYKNNFIQILHIRLKSKLAMLITFLIVQKLKKLL